ncbi:hypothetical protein [Romboutsia sp.]|uniref:hypothetical protein n=1 Tax=Romboutsia sp. TaxID=1965302 RepID=UPI003F2DDDD4
MTKRNKIIASILIGLTALIGGFVMGSKVGYKKAKTELVYEQVEIERDRTEYRAIKIEDEQDSVIKSRMQKMGIISYNKYTIPLSNGSTIIASPQVDKYYFIPYEMGEWVYEVDSQRQLENIVKTYISIKGTGKH